MRERTHVSARLADLQRGVFENAEVSLRQLNDERDFPKERRNLAWKILHNQAAGVLQFEIGSGDGAIRSMRFGHDDSLVATVGDSGRLRVRDVRLASRLMDAPGYKPHTNIRFPSDDKSVFGVSESGGIVLRSVRNADVLKTLQADREFTSQFDLSTDDRYVVAATRDRELLLIDVAEDFARVVPADNDKRVVGLWFQDHNRQIAAVTQNGIHTIWDADTLKVVRVRDLAKVNRAFSNVQNVKHCCDFADGEHLIASRQYITTVILRTDSESADPTLPLPLYDQLIEEVDFLPPSHALITTPRGMRLTHISGEGSDRMFCERSDACTASAVSDSGRRVAVGTSAGTTCIYGLEMPSAQLQHIRPQPGWPQCRWGAPISTAMLDTDGRFMLVGFDNGLLATIDLSTGVPVEACRLCGGVIRSLVVNRRLGWVACGVSSKTTAGIFALEIQSNGRLTEGDLTTEPVDVTPIASIRTKTIRDLVGSNDGSRLYAGLRNGELLVVDTSEWKIVRRRKAHERGTYAVAINGNSLLSGGSDGRLCQWDAESLKLQREWNAHSRRVTDVKFSPSGDRLFSVAHDTSAAIWEFDGTLVRRIRAPTSGILALDVSANGQTLATSGEDYVVRLWDAHTGDAQITLSGHSDIVRSVYFLSDQLATTSRDGSLRIWGPPELRSGLSDLPREVVR